LLLKDAVWAEMEQEIIRATIECPEAADPGYGVAAIRSEEQSDKLDAA
jgi:hypothetical protein